MLYESDVQKYSTNIHVQSFKHYSTLNVKAKWVKPEKYKPNHLQFMACGDNFLSPIICFISCSEKGCFDKNKS